MWFTVSCYITTHKCIFAVASFFGDDLALIQPAWLLIQLWPLSFCRTSPDIWICSDVNIWLVVEPYPSEKYELVSWNNDIPNWMGKNKVPNHQPEIWYRWSFFHLFASNFSILGGAEHVFDFFLDPLNLSIRWLVWLSIAQKQTNRFPSNLGVQWSDTIAIGDGLQHGLLGGDPLMMGLPFPYCSHTLLAQETGIVCKNDGN
jgi:hypothetical protein